VTGLGCGARGAFVWCGAEAKLLLMSLGAGLFCSAAAVRRSWRSLSCLSVASYYPRVPRGENHHEDIVVVVVVVVVTIVTLTSAIVGVRSSHC
jgi:hypothetical protein